MKFIHFLEYIVKDLFYYRARIEICIGILTITFAATALFTLLAFSKGTDYFIDHCYLKARPVVGTLQVVPKSGKHISKKQAKWIKKFVASHPQIAALSWNAEIPNFSIYKTKDQELLFDPQVAAVPYGDPLLDPSYGITYLQGEPFRKCRDFRFEAIVNTNFLQNYLEVPEKQIQDIVDNKNLALLPKHILIRFPPVAASPSSLNPGVIAVPIRGFFHLPEYPDLFLHFDVAQAYFHLGLEKWHPSYTLQFSDARGKPLVAHAKKNIYKIKKEDFMPLLKRDELSQGVKYNYCTLWLKDYQNQDRRSQVQQQIEKTNDKWKVIKPSDTVSASLNRVRKVVGAFTISSIVILFTLCSLSRVLLCIGYIFKKRQDIGLLKAYGMSSGTTATIFICQVVILCMMGYVIGLVTGLSLSSFLEAPAKAFIDNINPGYLVNQKILIINAHICRQAFILILCSALIGSIIPAVLSAQVNPAQQLRVDL